VNGLKVLFFESGGGLRMAENDVLIEFRDADSGASVDAGVVKFDLDMNMPGMEMHTGSTVTSAGGIGLYRARIQPEMAGDWTAQLKFDGSRGSGEVSFDVNVKP
jgi:uncharacterized protein YfaS (alpha-2-macroglobulin family)